MPAADPSPRIPVSLRIRIVAAFLALVAIELVVVAFLVLQLDQVTRAQALVTDGYLPLSLETDQLRGEQARVAEDLDRLVRPERRAVAGDRRPALVYAGRLPDGVAVARVLARDAGRMSTDPEETAVLHRIAVHLARVEELAKRFQQETEGFVHRAELGEPAEGLPAGFVDADRALAEELDSLSTLLEDRIRTLGERAEVARDRARTLGIGLSAVTLGLALLALLAVLWALRPIGALTTHAQRLARGERPGRLDVSGTDEVALLSREFDRMVEAVEQRDQALRERAEELGRLSRYLANVLDSLEGGLFVVENGVVTLANPAALRVLGVAPGTAPPADLLGQRELVRPDGTIHVLHDVPFGEGGAIVSSANVTEQRAAQLRLANSERLALVGQMLAQITHEVRNPLNALSLNAELLRDELERLDPEKRTEAWPILATVSGEIDRLTDVTAHYLQLARRPRARPEPQDLREILLEVERLLKVELDQGGVVLAVEAAVPSEARVDGNQLRQALLNLVRNAVESGAHRIGLGLGGDERAAEITVADDGAGMSAEDQDRAFDPFYSTKATGTGLGLAITRQIVDDHGGTIDVRSAPGAGTTFRLRLPR